MARIAENAVIQDGVWYNPGEEIPDLGNWVRVHHDGAKRYYEGVSTEIDTKNAVTRVDEMKKPVELVEVGEDIGIRAKDDVSSSLAARYAKAYSERMSTVNPEFE